MPKIVRILESMHRIYIVQSSQRQAKPAQTSTVVGYGPQSLNHDMISGLFCRKCKNWPQFTKVVAN